MAIRGKYREVKTGDLKPNSYNPNVQSDFMFERQQESLKQMAFLDPILVRSTPDGLEIIDGEHRWKAATKLGEAKVSVIDIGDVSDSEAKQLTILMNELRGKPERTALAALISELVEGDGGDLARAVLPYTDTEISAFAEMTSFDWSTLDDADQGRGGEGGDEGEGAPVKFAFELAPADAQELREALTNTGAKGDAAAALALARFYTAEAGDAKDREAFGGDD